jgi:hypothetical protein
MNNILQVWKVNNYGKGVIDGSQDFYRITPDASGVTPTVPTLQEVLQQGNDSEDIGIVIYTDSGNNGTNITPSLIEIYDVNNQAEIIPSRISFIDIITSNGLAVDSEKIIKGDGIDETKITFETSTDGSGTFKIPDLAGEEETAATREWVEAGITTDFVTIDPSATGQPETQGTMAWDVDNETVSVILNGYKMLIGEDQFYPVKNQTGSTITKGTNVKFAGTLGASGRLLIAPFIADGTDPSYVYMGVTAEDILNGEDGKVLWFGRLRGINTNAFDEGDILYASTTSAGGFQTAIPTGSNNVVQVAAVIKKSSTQGVIFIRPQIEPLLVKPESVTTATTGSDISFTTPQVYNSPSSPSTSNLTNTLTGARIGVVQKIYHNNATAPTVPAGWVLIGGSYETSELNIIYAEFVSGSRVEYWVIQEQ